MIQKEKQSTSASVIRGRIDGGIYKGRTIEVHFGKPLKILCGGVDITNVVVNLNISLSSHGQLISLTLAELDCSQVPEETWANMVGHEFGVKIK